ncbi:MAG: hypothetical protein KF819_29800 [Labilithrix sp.]|nr:hypothetical protein [Labilithrix sp.]
MPTLGREPLRVDIMTSISGVAFREAWRGSIEATLGGHMIHVLGRNELIRNKKASGRPQDLADIALLEEMDRLARSTTTRAAAKRRR